MPGRAKVDEVQVCMEYLSGESGKTLALKYKLDHHTIYAILRRNGHSTRTKTDAMINAYAQGRHLGRLGKHHTEEARREMSRTRKGKPNYKKRIYLHLEADICNDYLNGGSSSTLSEKYSIPRGTMLKILKKGGALRNMSDACKLKMKENRGVGKRNHELLAQADQICQDYINGESGYSLANKYNTTQRAIQGILEANETPRRSLSEAFILGRRMGRIRFTEKQREAVMRLMAGRNHPNWNVTGRQKPNKYGYVFVRRSEKSNKWMAEHRLIAQMILGRELIPNETIHHINYIKSDNRVDNLYYFPTNGKHASFHCMIDKPKLVSNLAILGYGQNIVDY